VAVAARRFRSSSSGTRTVRSGNRGISTIFFFVFVIRTDRRKQLCFINRHLFSHYFTMETRHLRKQTFPASVYFGSNENKTTPPKQQIVQCRAEIPLGPSYSAIIRSFVESMRFIIEPSPTAPKAGDKKKVVTISEHRSIVFLYTRC